jgi:hypothetical protein
MMKLRTMLAVGLLGALGLVAAGCGGNTSTNSAYHVANMFVQQLNHGNFYGACRLATLPSSQWKACAAAEAQVAFFYGGLPGFNLIPGTFQAWKTGNVEHARVEAVDNIGGYDGQVNLVKTKDGWRVVSITEYTG